MAGDSIDEARSYYEAAYNGRDFEFGRTASVFGFRYTSIGDADVSLRTSLYDGAWLRGRIAVEREYVVSWITAGGGVIDLRRGGIPVALGHPVVLPTGRVNEFDLSDVKQSLLHFGADFLERIAAEEEGIVGALTFETVAVPVGPTLQRWTATVNSVARVIHDPDASELLRAEAKRAAAVAMLRTFPHSGVDLPSEVGTLPAGRIRRAIEFIHAHAQLPLSITEVADAAGLRPRGLQAAFRRELGVTPHDYLRRVRLDRVRAELSTAGAGTTVSEVARRWGFAHMGRFAASYLQRFDEYPSQTIGG